jgi:peptidoglycan/LPS O-acetylase OafA/YrhL
MGGATIQPAGGAAKPDALYGTMCCSAYLVHWPITKAIFSIGGWSSPLEMVLWVLPACVVGSLARAWMTHRAVEKRYLGAVTQFVCPGVIGQAPMRA